MKVAFFDRDGTIALDYPDNDWSHIEEPVLLPYVIEAMKYISSVGYKIIIITNQYIIGEGYITQSQYEDYNKKLLSILKENDIEILDVFFCPHKRSDNCKCCKPATGMVESALLKYPEIDLDKSFVVGDSISDMQLAEELNVKAYGLGIDFDYAKYERIDNLKELIK